MIVEAVDNRINKDWTNNRLGYRKLHMVEIVDALNKILSNYSVHAHKLQNFHWNVEGADFFDLHSFFEIQYSESQKAIDDLAERIRVFDARPLSTMKDQLDHATILEVHSTQTAVEMVAEILNDYEILLDDMFRALEIAVKCGDIGTEDLIKPMIRTVEKNYWMLTSFSKKS